MGVTLPVLSGDFVVLRRKRDGKKAMVTRLSSRHEYAVEDYDRADVQWLTMEQIRFMYEEQT